MSGSSDQLAPAGPVLESEPPGGDGDTPPAGQTSRRSDDLEAPTRPARSERASASAPIVPAGSVTGRSLTLVITIMCCLACLTAGTVYMVNQSAAAWMRNIASEVTVQIEPKDSPEETEQVVAKVVEYLARQPGIRSVRAMPLDESNALLEPWLGQTDALRTIPVPRLIAIDLNRAAPPELDRLKALLADDFEGAELDDHRHWQAQIRTVTRSLALGGLAVLILVGAATTAVIISATRSAMSANREIVEVLHFVGATDRFIAREFEKHFLALGIRAGLVGALAALAVFLIMPALVPFLGGGAVTAAELRNFVGGGALDLQGYLLLGIVVVVIAALCMLTSRYSVFRILHART